MRADVMYHAPRFAAPLAILAGGFAMSWLCDAYPAHLPFWTPWDFSWPEFLATAFTLWAYARGLAATLPARRPRALMRVGFIGGVAVTYFVLQTHFDYLAQHMFTLTRVQHLVTHHLGPFLMALAAPGPTLWRGLPAPMRRLAERRWVRRSIDRLQQPIIAGLVFVGLLFLWLIPPIQFAAMLDRRLYAVMNASMVLDGILFWALILDPRPRARAMRLLLVFAVQLPQIVGGAFIAFIGRPLYPYYQLCGRIFPAVNDQTDQQLGGFVILYGGGMMSAIAALLLVQAMWAAEHRAAHIIKGRRERSAAHHLAAGIDG